MKREERGNLPNQIETYCKVTEVNEQNKTKWLIVVKNRNLDNWNSSETDLHAYGNSVYNKEQWKRLGWMPGKLGHEMEINQTGGLLKPQT